jgi:nucleotide-binding universal stress UspA family protein
LQKTSNDISSANNSRKMKTFLLPTDFSDDADHAVSYGYQLALSIKANIVLCNAVLLPAEAPQVGLSVWPVEESDVLLKESAAKLTHLELKLEKTKDNSGFKPHITCINEGGTVMHVINKAIEKEDIDLVVIGAHEDGYLNTLLLGNQSRLLIDVITKPLLLVPPEAKIISAKKIGFATDFENIESELRSIQTLVSFAKPLHAKIVITHIYNKKPRTDEVKQAIKKLMQTLLDGAEYPQIHYQAFTNSSTESGLDWVCQNGQIDILAMVHRSHTFIDSIFRGSRTQTMADRVQIPLLIFPANS